MRFLALPFKSEKAFSLIEVVLVVLIVGFIILVLANLPNSLKLVGSSRHESLAREIVSKKIEDLRSIGYDNLCNPSPDPCIDSISDTRLSSLPGSSGQTIIEACPGTVCTDGEAIKKVSAKVTWIEAGNNKKVEMVTLITQGGLK